MGKLHKLLILFLSFVFLKWAYQASYAVINGSRALEKIDLAKEPIQTELPQPVIKKVVRENKEFTYALHSPYEISGKVIASAVYRVFDTNPFYDVDVALVWGKPEKELDEIMKHYLIFQGGRWVFFESKDQRPKEEVSFLSNHFANNHLIPSENSKLIANVLKMLEKNQHIRIKGYLADIFDSNGKLFVRSSRVRNDSGGGACEIIWVDEIQVEDKVYR
ncbi:MAG: hypothetical protein EBR01_07130 [Proteobacteria bacterium]|nr:hypothetical protein [Pseudomonadota bacterium]